MYIYFHLIFFLSPSCSLYISLSSHDKTMPASMFCESFPNFHVYTRRYVEIRRSSGRQTNSIAFYTYRITSRSKLFPLHYKFQDGFLEATRTAVKKLCEVYWVKNRLRCNCMHSSLSSLNLNLSSLKLNLSSLNLNLSSLNLNLSSLNLNLSSLNLKKNAFLRYRIEFS